MTAQVALATSKIACFLKSYKSKALVCIALWFALLGLAGAAMQPYSSTGSSGDWNSISGNCTLLRNAAPMDTTELKVEVVNSTGGAAVKDISGNVNDMFVKFYFKLENGFVDPNAKTRICEVWYPPRGSRHMLNLWCRNGRFSLQYVSQTTTGAGGGWKNPSADVSVGIWHYVKLRATLGPQGGGAFWFDGRKVSEYTGDYSGCGPISSVDVGAKVFSSGMHGIIDIGDVTIGNTAQRSTSSPPSPQG